MPRMDARTPAFDFAAFRKQITSPALLAIADHWHQAAGDAAMPSWSQIKPSAIAPHLTQVWSFRYDREADAFTARLAGNRIMSGFGKSFRGDSLEDLHPAFKVAKIHAVLRRTVVEPCIYRSHGALFRVGDYVGAGERIILPLAGDGHSGDGALGASEYEPVPQGLHGKPVELLHEYEEWYSAA